MIFHGDRRRIAPALDYFPYAVSEGKPVILRKCSLSPSFGVFGDSAFVELIKRERAKDEAL